MEYVRKKRWPNKRNLNKSKDLPDKEFNKSKDLPDKEFNKSKDLRIVNLKRVLIIYYYPEKHIMKVNQE